MLVSTTRSCCVFLKLATRLTGVAISLPSWKSVAQTPLSSAVNQQQKCYQSTKKQHPHRLNDNEDGEGIPEENAHHHPKVEFVERSNHQVQTNIYAQQLLILASMFRRLLPY